jgi:hypothetical protein
VACIDVVAAAMSLACTDEPGEFIIL